MQLTTAEAKKLMRKLELECVECKHHTRAFFTHNGRKMWPVHCSFGNKDMPGDVPDRFRVSLRLSIEEFEVLRSCKMDRAAYVELLRRKGDLTD